MDEQQGPGDAAAPVMGLGGFGLPAPAGVASEFGEGIESAAPDDAVAGEGQQDGAEAGEEQNRSGGSVEEGQPGGDLNGAAAGKVGERDGCVGEKSRDRGPPAKSKGGERQEYLQGEAEAAEESQGKPEAESGKAILFEGGDDAEDSTQPAHPDKAWTESHALAVTGALEHPAEARVFDDLHAQRPEAA